MFPLFECKAFPAAPRVACILCSEKEKNCVRLLPYVLASDYNPKWMHIVTKEKKNAKVNHSSSSVVKIKNQTKQNNNKTK